MSRLRLFPLNRGLLGRLLLILTALTLLAGGLAWLPSTAQAAPQTETSAAVVLRAWIVNRRLYVEASGLPRDHVFSLRARRNAQSDWTRLARVRANRYGELDKEVRLPSYLARAERLQVCLKDMDTDRLYCTRARRQY